MGLPCLGGIRVLKIRGEFTVSVHEAPLKRTVLGVPITCFHSYDHAVGYLTRRLGETRTFCVAINPEKVCLAHANATFSEIVRDADVHICDGIGTAMAMWLLWGVRIPRITGVGLFFQMVTAAEEQGLSVFLLGATPESNAAAVRRLCERHPHLRIAGCRDGYFKDDEAVVQQINVAKADLLFVALGSPKQERWIAHHWARLAVPFCMGIGGSLDVVAGRVRWAPGLFRTTGTEWLYRLVREPWRWRRQSALPRFALSVLRQRFWR